MLHFSTTKNNVIVGCREQPNIIYSLLSFQMSYFSAKNQHLNLNNNKKKHKNSKLNKQKKKERISNSFTDPAIQNYQHPATFAF